MLKHLLIAGFILGNTISVVGQTGTHISDKNTITDKDIVVPEEIERNFDQLVVDWKKDLRPSLDCDSENKPALTYEDSIYISRLYSLPTEMELVYNPIVRSYIDMYTGRRKSGVGYFLGKSKYFFPIFERALDKYGLPLELKYLPIIESALNPTIVSRAGATGLWQFMIGTGKMYDLEINSLVDERRDPIKSSEAAAKYLKDLYGIYNDWNLVIAAYNCGPGNVNKAIKRSGGETDYWAIYNYLPKETRGYVPAFIAAAYIMNYYNEHNICPFEYKYTLSTDTIHIDKQLHLQQIADVLSVDIDELRNLNPQYKKDIVPGEFKQYILKLPSVKATDFVVNKDTIYSYKFEEFLAHRKVVEPKGYTQAFSGAKVRYKVRRGDNLGSIARKYGITVNQLKSWNGLKSNRLNVGQVLAVSNKPAKTTKNPVKPKEEPILLAQKEDKSTTSKSTEQTEDSGSSTSGLLGQYYARVHESNTAKPEKQEPIVDTTTSPPDSINSDYAAFEEFVSEIARDDLQTTQTIYHKVRIGETLTQIATKYNVSRKEIKSWNKLSSSVPKVGQRLMIHLPPQKEDVKELIPEISDNVSVEEMAANVKTETEKPINRQTASTNTVVLKTPSADINNKADKKAPEQKKKAKSGPQTTIYTVKKGDTLGHIAMRYGGKATPQQIMKTNNLRSDKLSIGQKLKIPKI